ncbi:hypothetical protein EPUL_002612 [Erysiphe pulchra]|uniref:Uncharacterized protein n=1 Tax=Erysiphe pulchra TaxID=225359 RepID=A0A2S4PPI4_9PEZI|nr:hypothetical protein EPUL_002612 [Erysiphe pulchra]
MAPPAFTKRGPPPDSPDAGNRVSKTTLALNRTSGTTISKPHSTLYTNIALHKSSTIVKKLGVEQFSIDYQADKVDMDVELEELSINTINSDPFEEDFLPLGFMMIILLRASQRVEKPMKKTEVSHYLWIPSKVSNPSWAEKVGVAENVTDYFTEKANYQSIASPWVKLGPDHEARKTGSFELRQKTQQFIPDKSFIADIWSVPSGVTILAPSPAKAATLLQYKQAIENRFGDASVEKQETWNTFIVRPIPKKIRDLDGFFNLFDGLI